jgi:phosphatidylserine/phosphatidylglycerophosphate/cardiolipin synthase-like enzyme
MVSRTLGVALVVSLLVGSGACAAVDEADEELDDVTDREEGIASKATSIAGHPVYAHFTNPPSAAGNDPTILAELVRLVDATPAGEEIRIAIHSLTVNEVASALAAAKQRGVTVYAVEDGSDQFDEDESPRKLHEALGDHHRFCGDGVKGGNEGCITRDASGIMHTKLALFSRATDPNGTPRSNVSWFGSANLTHATGAKTFNNTVSVYGDSELYDGFVQYFGRLWSMTHYTGNDFYDASAKRGFINAATARVYASPEQDGDLVYNRLDDIDADGSCRIRVAQAMIHGSRSALVDLLVRHKKHGCRVWVVASSIDPAPLATLKAAGIPVRHQKVHDKTVLVKARFAGSEKTRSLIFTGSHNWTHSANYRNDELFVRLESEDLYDAYYAHFNDAYGTGDPL